MHTSNEATYELLAIKSFERYKKNDNFYFYNDGLNGITDWKLHISVRSSDIAKAYNLIHHLLEENFHTFKVISDDYPEEQRHYRGAQFTLALSQGHQDNVDDLQVLLKKIELLLIDNNIEPGFIPESDAKLLEKNFFSLRYDGSKIFERELEEHEYYLSANTVGKNYNPLNSFNPYNILLHRQDDAFDLIRHFEKFEVRSLYCLSEAIGFSCLAFLQNQGESTINNIKKNAKRIENCTTSEDFLEAVSSLDEKNTFAYLFLQTFFGMPNLATLNMLREISLQDFYPKDDEIGQLLRKVDQIKMGLPFFDKNHSQPCLAGPGTRFFLYFDKPCRTSFDLLNEGSLMINQLLEMKNQLDPGITRPKI